MNEKIKWYYHRLSAMSYKEIIFRSMQEYKKKKYKFKYKKDKTILDLNKTNLNLNNKELKARIKSHYMLDQLEDINSNYDFLIYSDLYNLNDKINWHRGQQGEWPKNKYSKSFDFKGKDNIGEIRYTWELNRMQFLPYLSIKYIHTKEDHLLEIGKRHFYNWIEENSFLKGVNWSSSMEVAIRAYQWMIAFCILYENTDDSQFLSDLLKASIFSIAFVMDNLSLFSSANNHLIVEAAISSIIGYLIKPVYEQDWFDKGYQILERQVPLQVYSDGVNKEQSTHYHSFVLEMLLHYNFFVKSISQKSIHDVYMYNMLEFLGYLYEGGEVTELGDSDDGKLITLGYNNGRQYYTYLLQLGSSYFDEKFIECNKIYPEVKLFTGYIVADDFKKHAYKQLKVYKEGGYVILKCNNDYLIFDVGPLGFGSIAAHGHADALSFTYNYKNKPILVDPGTYIYNIKLEWRDYFRKTVHHNTLSKNIEDQSTMNGPFIWSKKAEAELLDIGMTENIYFMVGKHDGYSPYIHQRAISYMQSEELLILEDEFSGVGQINFTLNSDLKVQKISSNLVFVENVGIYMCFSKPFRIVEKWISKNFLMKEKSLGIEVANNFDENPKIYTIISKRPVHFFEDGFIYDNRKFKYSKYNKIKEVR